MTRQIADAQMDLNIAIEHYVDASISVQKRRYDEASEKYASAERRRDHATRVLGTTIDEVDALFFVALKARCRAYPAVAAMFPHHAEGPTMTETDASDFGYTLPDDHEQTRVPADVAAMVGAPADACDDDSECSVCGKVLCSSDPDWLVDGCTRGDTVFCRVCWQAWIDADTCEHEDTRNQTRNPVLNVARELPIKPLCVLCRSIPCLCDDQADAIHDRASRQHGRLTQVLAGAALTLVCLMPGHASARESLPEAAYLNPPANCVLYLSFEDHSSLAYCPTDGFIGYDSDGPVTGWHLIRWAHTSAR